MNNDVKKLIMKPDKTVIYFTVASGTVYGIIISIIILFLTNQDNINMNIKIILSLFSFFLIMSSLIYSILNLKNSKKNWNILYHFQNSWLSREGLIEIITLISLLFFYVFWIITNNSTTSFILVSISSFFSVITIFFTTKVYLTLKTIPAWYNLFTVIIYIFNSLVLGSLILFSLLFFFNIENKLLANFVIIISLSALFIKIFYWYSIKLQKKSNNNMTKKLERFKALNLSKALQIRNDFLTSKNIEVIDNISFFSLRSIVCVLTYLTPTYYLVQQPSLVISIYVSKITFIIITLLAILGMFIERWLFFIESQQNANFYYDNYTT